MEYNLDDEQPSLNDPVVMDDLSDQTTSDVIDPFRRVPFVIKKASIRTQLEDNKAPKSEDNRWKVKRLALQAAVAPEGVDGDGKYAGKIFFPEFVLAFNASEFPDDYASEWWTKRSRGPTKELFTALGYDVKALPPITQEFLDDLASREFVGDIKRGAVRRKGPDGKYADTGDFENTLQSFRAASNGNGDM